MGDHNNGHVSNLFEDSWFFGNTLLNNTSKSSYTQKMVRCNSDPSPSSSSKDATSISPLDPSKLNSKGLIRTPSLPISLGREGKYEINEDENEEEEDEPRMGDLIRQAMPMPMPMPRVRRLDRTPSLPISRGKQVLNVASNNVENNNGGVIVGKLSRRESLESSMVLKEKGPIAMTKLTRRASIDTSMLPPKYNASKGTKPSTSNSKNRPHRKMEPPPNTITTPPKPEPKLNKIMSQKSLSDLEVEELQGFKDLGFSFDNKDLNPKVAQLLPALQRTSSLDSAQIGKVRRPYLSESWQKQQQSSSPLSAPPVPNWAEQKPSSSDDLKAQIKFWARAVASNVRQEC